MRSIYLLPAAAHRGDRHASHDALGDSRQAGQAIVATVRRAIGAAVCALRRWRWHTTHTPAAGLLAGRLPLPFLKFRLFSRSFFNDLGVSNAFRVNGTELWAFGRLTCGEHAHLLLEFEQLLV